MQEPRTEFSPQTSQESPNLVQDMLQGATMGAWLGPVGAMMGAMAGSSLGMMRMMAAFAPQGEETSPHAESPRPQPDAFTPPMQAQTSRQVEPAPATPRENASRHAEPVHAPVAPLPNVPAPSLVETLEEAGVVEQKEPRVPMIDAHEEKTVRPLVTPEVLQAVEKAPLQQPVVKRSLLEVEPS